jgi:hypothetical protein
MRGEYLDFTWRNQRFSIPHSRLSNSRVQELLRRKSVSVVGIQRTLIRPKPIQKPLSFDIKKRVRRTRVRRKRGFLKPLERRGMSIQERRLRRLPKKYGVPSDIFDFHAEMDRTLTYAENKRMFVEKIKKIAPMESRVLSMDLEGLKQKWEAQRRAFFMKNQYMENHLDKIHKSLSKELNVFKKQPDIKELNKVLFGVDVLRKFQKKRAKEKLFTFN